MASINIRKGAIPQITQQVFVDSKVDRDLWCSQVSLSSGLGGCTATFELPFAIADEVGYRYHNKKIIVRAGYQGALQTVFIGYITGQAEEIADAEDKVEVQGYTAGHFLAHRGVGEDTSNWRYYYPLFDDQQGTPTGWTPAAVLYDLFARLPEGWLTQLKLGNLTALGGAYDLPVSSYDFTLSTYAEAIDAIISSLGDVMLIERFYNDFTYLDFLKISDPVAPVISTLLAHWDEAQNANVGRIRWETRTDNIVNRAMAYGTDKEFMISCKNVVTDLPLLSEQPFSEGYYPTALVDYWDASLEAFALQDPDLCNSDKVSRSCVIKENQFANGFANGAPDGDPSPNLPAPGTVGTAFYADCEIELIPLKTVLIAPSTGEKMLVTAFSPGEPGYKEGDTIPLPEGEAGPPEIATESKAEKHAHIVVTRMHQATENTVAANLLYEDSLDIEVPGLGFVFRRFKLPEILKKHKPKLEFRNDLPKLTAEGERHETQAWIYPTMFYPDAEKTNVRNGNFSEKPKLMSGAKFDFDKMTVVLDEPATMPIKEELIKKTRTNADDEVETESERKVTYGKTVVGVTFSFINPTQVFGWDTSVIPTELMLPWGTHTARVKLDDMLYQQSTTQGHGFVDGAENEIHFDAVFIDPETGNDFYGFEQFRNDLPYLKTAAERLLVERCNKHVVAAVDIPWISFGYQLGYQLMPLGLDTFPKDRIFITQVTHNMPVEGDHGTSLTADSVKPPKRMRWSVKKGRAV